MSWLFSQALGAEYSAANSSDGKPSAQLNVMPTPHKFSLNDKTMEPLRLSRFGLTLALLTEQNGEDMLTWFREGFLVKTCQAQEKGAGLHGTKSNLWFEFLRIIGEVRPKYAFIENSRNLRTKGLGTVLEGLAEIGYDAAWTVLSAKELGACHERERMWILAADTNLPQCSRGSLPSRGQETHEDVRMDAWWQAEPRIRRVDDGLAYRAYRLKCTGNGQVPIVAATAFTHLQQELHKQQGA